MRKTLALSTLLAFIVGCASLYTATVTLTDTVDSAMKMWANLSNNGKTTAAIDAKVTAAHDKYRASCAVAATALTAYKQSGDPTQYNAAVQSAFAAAGQLVDLILPLVTPAQATDLKTKLGNSKTI